MAGEGIFPKADGDTLFGSDANDMAEIVTVIAAENITVGQLVYIHLTSNQAYVSDTGTANDIRANGVALNTAIASGSVSIKQKGLYTTTGLTANTTYYLGATGALSATVSAVRVGRALSTTQLFIDIVQDDRDIVGTMKPYSKSTTGVPAKSAFWVECAGGTVSDAESPLNGQTIPNVNGTTEATKRFIRGSTTSGTTGGTDTHSHSVPTTDVDGSGPNAEGNAGSTGSSANIPPYHEMVFMWKVK